MPDIIEPPTTSEGPILQKDSTPPGWLIDIYASVTDAGVVITRLDIKTDPSVDPLNGVTATVLDSIKLPAFRAEISDLLQAHADDYDAALDDVGVGSSIHRLLTAKAEKVRAQAALAAAPEKRRSSIKKHRTWADQAEQALTAATQANDQGVGLNRVLQERWVMKPEGVRSRIRRLRERKYIEGQGRSIQPGPALDAQ